ncbi:proton-conducting transporter transmembrane domain-containing protein [Nakamurella endophytica]|uniref:NADH:quinone oxidoreductase/Mrp antiporter transmembrane domain-containing protein n=1 Tax=Nakamurella endophytica TaxID=1748367 RepID=A0A917T546_9ACTN|nr:proton-conducting transporter membrane subunit [Nakamurella endophytica]GGM09684.1 hypothetical protein GCM10011594_31950 [Nakamurella endophytica]
MAVLSQAALVIAVLFPATVGVLLCLGGSRIRRSASTVAVVVAAGGLVLASAVALTRPVVSVPFVAGADFALAVDGLAALVLPAVAAVALLVLVFAGGDIRGATGRFFGLMLLFSAAVTVTVTAATLPTLLVAWEVMGATSYALIGFRWRRSHDVAAGETAFLTTRLADLGLYAAAAAALAGGAGWALADLPAAPGGWVHVAAGGVLVAALGKAAQLPFSFWLSRAMQGPSPVSALLHSAAMVAMGGFLLLRTAPLLAATGWAATVAAWAGAVTAVLLGLVAVAQRDLKQLLAASTSAQLGFVVLAAGVSAVAGGTAHLIAHAATKALLFLAAGAWLSALGTRELAALRGAARRWPLVGVCAGVGAVTLAGVPPLSLWATKDEVLAAAREASVPLYLTGLVGAVLSAAYAAKVLRVVLASAPVGVQDRYDQQERGTRRIGEAEWWPMVPLAAAAAVLSVLALPPVGSAVRRVLGDTTSPSPDWTSLLLTGAVSAAVVVLVVWRGLPALRWAAGWLGLERAAHRLVVRPVLALADGLARFDDRVVDGGVRGAASMARAAAQRVARFDDRAVDGAVRGAARGGVRLADVTARVDEAGIDRAVQTIARGARRLGTLARRPQTGQLHQYYAQVVIVLGAAAALAAVSVLFMTGG